MPAGGPNIDITKAKGKHDKFVVSINCQMCRTDRKYDLYTEVDSAPSDQVDSISKTITRCKVCGKENCLLIVGLVYIGTYKRGTYCIDNGYNQ